MRKISCAISLVSFLLAGNYCLAQTITEVDNPLANAALFYDFDQNGSKEFIIITKGTVTLDNGGWVYRYQFNRTGDYSAKFATDSLILTANDIEVGNVDIHMHFLEDVNNDGTMDFGGLYYFYSTKISQTERFYSVISDITGYSSYESTLVIPGCDLNNDGYQDYLSAPGFSRYRDNNNWFVWYGQGNGSFLKEHMNIMTLEEYENGFNPEAWASTTPVAWNGLITPSRQTAIPMIGGLSTAARSPLRADIRAIPSIKAGHRAPSMGSLLLLPTKVIDLNGDGLNDLVDENSGMAYFNVGDGKWIKAEIGGQVLIADLNGDGVQDYIVPGDNLELYVYSGGGEYAKQTLYRNVAVDKDIYCYDFDHDGDVDILVTFSSPFNQTQYSYTLFFVNDGNGAFTQNDEQDYGDKKLWFRNCQDIDGDGYMDLLATGCRIFDDGMRTWGSDGNVYLLKGKSDLTFAAPVKLYEAFDSSSDNIVAVDEDSYFKINAEDIDNDGKMEIWASMGNSHDFASKYYNVDDGIVNTAPSAPGKPELIYSNGWLLINWNEGSDAQTQAIDLTYALRIGTTPGGGEILRANANADGSRRNFLDGNMNKSHSYAINLGSVAPADIYVAVQAIDAQHKGSAWSQEATVRHTAVPVSFALSSDNVNLNDTVTVYFTALPAGYSHDWKADDGSVSETADNTIRISFSKSGKKKVIHTLTSPDGNSFQYMDEVTVNNVRLGSIEDMDYAPYQSIRGFGKNAPLADYNFDGYIDIACNSVIWRGSENFRFAQAPGIWNTGLSSFENVLWYDWDHNGAVDFISQSQFNASYYLPHNGTGNLTAKQEDDNINWLFHFDRSIEPEGEELFDHESTMMIKADLLHDGNYTLLGFKSNYHNGKSDNFYLYHRNQNGGYEPMEKPILTDFTEFHDCVWNEDDRFICDFDHDGFLDLAYVYSWESDPFTELKVFLNKGDGGMEYLSVPFIREFAKSDMRHLRLVDLNNDGCYDLFGFRHSDFAPYIMWNNNNLLFGAPQILPIGNLDAFYEIESFDSNSDRDYYYFADLNNDGYQDIICQQINSEVGNTDLGTYVFYMGPEGVADQGFIAPEFASRLTDWLLQLETGKWTLMPNDYFDKDLDTDCKAPYMIVEPASNEKPMAPTGVRAVQTADGLLIEWNDAVDDHTPATQMRYNLSVRHKGQNGAGAFVISPQNGLNANALYLPGYQYISATRYLVPVWALQAGEYEIQLQSVDLLNSMSGFSEPLTVKIDRQVIEAPTLVSIGKEAVISYMGQSVTSTPAWDFDGGQVVSGSGFGPYRVIWNTQGIKKISLTIDGITSERMVLVDVNDAQVSLPDYLFEGSAVKVDIPDNMTAHWKIVIDGVEHSLTSKGIDGWGSDITVAGNEIKVERKPNYNSLGLKLMLFNANGTEKVFEKSLSILDNAQLPQILLVSPDADGHNVIRFEASAQYFPQVSILKETNVYNLFMEIARVPASDGSYTDIRSYVETKAERYAVAGVMSDGNLSPQSGAHQNIHLTINRGLQANSYNLIWSQYQGADVATYNILRGSSESALTQIGSVSGNVNSFTDVTPDGSQPYYAIEYVMAQEGQNAALRREGIAYAPSRGNLKGQSNTVNTSAAYSVVYAEGLAICSYNGSYKLSSEQPALYLYAEFMPVTATYKSVTWEIVEGANLATVDGGLLLMKSDATAGTVKVKATAVDGSGKSAVCEITVEAPKSFDVTFKDWDGTVLGTDVVKWGEAANAPKNPSRDGWQFAGWDTDFSSVTSDLVVTALYRINTLVDRVTEKPQVMRALKVLDKDGKLYFILPDGRKLTPAGIEIVR